MKNLIIIGSGGHAVSCIDVVNSQKKFKIIGILCDYKKKNTKILNYKIIGKISDLPKFRKNCSNILIGVGQIHDPKIRLKLFTKCKKYKFNLPKIISSKAVVSKFSKIAEGTIVHHQVIINANSIIGKNCIINSKSLIEHDVEIGDNCHISTNSTINGNCKIGQNTFVGSSSVISNNIKIRKNQFIKLGSVVKKSI